jgi:hypothetical protein
MVIEAQSWPRALPLTKAWPPDDTEESILGIDLHQGTITNLRLGINEAAQVYKTPGQPVPWKAETQLLFLGCKHPNGTAYRTLPDLFVFPGPIDPLRGTFTLRVDGPPILIIEVLSPSTYKADLDLESGKPFSYAQAGVREYMAIDPTAVHLPEGIRAWRLEDGIYRQWEADADGRFQSMSIAVSIGLEGMLSTVYTHSGRRMLHEGEIEAELARRDAELARLQHLLDEKSAR